MANGNQIVPVSIEDEMRTSFIDYAMSVIIARAIPDVCDGLKPVHRRILYAMLGEGLTHGHAYSKCAGIVGEVLKKYHPHGDAAVYDALVRLAQEWNMRYLLVDGQGNFGSVDGDPPAAYRYTEARLTALAEELLVDIDKETVDFLPNFDGKEVEPVVLPARIPNLMINGSSGIAVGMATNIPPHNLREIVRATVAVAKTPAITLDELIEIVPGPDFPTGAFILGRSGIRAAYATGRGQIIMRARTLREELRGGREAIIVTEIPYQVNKAKTVEKMAELVREKRLEGISDLRDESDRDGMRVVIELKKDAVPEVVLNQLYKMTPLQESFGVINLAIVDGRPKLLTLKDALARFVEHRRAVVTRRSAFELREAEKRYHLLEGYRIAIDRLDAVIALIRRARDAAQARDGLMTSFGLTEPQAQAILDMRLARLTAMESDKINADLEETARLIARLRELLDDEAKVLEVVVAELEAIEKEYGDERRTEILEEAGDISVEDMIADEDMVVTVTHSGYIKRNPVSLYRAQRRGGRGVAGMETREEDFVSQIFVASTHSHIMMFTDTGRAYSKKVYEVPQAGRAARGKALANLLELREGERVVQMLPVREFREGQFVLMATRKGVVKKTDLMEFDAIRANGIIAIQIDEGDQLIDAQLTDGTRHVLLPTRGGMAIRFPEDQVRPMGRNARGVIGIRLEQGDGVVGMAILEAESTASILTVCEQGFGKRTDATEYRVQNRGGVGIITIKTTDRNGPVVGCRIVEDADHLMTITDGGKIIRMPVAGISVIGRNTQGVRLVRLEENEKIAAVERLAEVEPESEGEPGASGDGSPNGSTDGSPDGPPNGSGEPPPS
jgi:DNA gyrase subunit A